MEESEMKYEKLEKETLLKNNNNRTVYINKKEKNNFCTNSISTAKYYLLLFPIQNILHQFKRVSNCYFFLVFLLQVNIFLNTIVANSKFVTCRKFSNVVSTSFCFFIYNVKRCS
jgi:hypothetical protein